MKQPILRALDVPPVHHLLLHRLRRAGGTVVLNLHRVTPEDNPFWVPMHPAHFEELLRFVRRHFEVILFRDLERTGESARKGSGRPRLILSFDDGYYDFVEYVLPLLHKYGLPANQNVISGCIDSGLPPWVVLMCDFFRTAPLSLINESIPSGFEGRLERDDYASKLRFGLAISRYLKMMPRAERGPKWEHVEATMGRGDFRPTRMMSAADVAALPESCEVGCHSHSHESMGIESLEFFRDDFERCRPLFDETLRRPLRIYSFPNGSYRQDQLEFLREAGLEHILLVDEMLSGDGRVHARLTMAAQSESEARLMALGLRARGVHSPAPTRKLS
jgi:peptidoglycan/xylan/chitin deacetylase (PgdA/CDA1 family)